MPGPALPLPVVILAGGLATRLRPLTERIPKALVEVAGRPFLEHQLALLRDRGIQRAVLCVAYLGETIEARLGDGSQLGIRLDYCYDGPELLGTGGAIRRALPLLGEGFFVLYGDSYLDCDYAAVAEAFRRSGRRGLMTVYRNDGCFDASNVEYAGGEILRYDKRARTPGMRYIDYGLGVFRRSVFEEIPEGTARDLATVYQDLLQAGDLAAYESTERFYEIGSPEGLRETAEYLAGRSTGKSQSGPD
jgi:NDP-sugar pyrophosphorylase family protein